MTRLRLLGMEPRKVEIKVTVDRGVDDAVAALGLGDGDRWGIVFCEDVTPAASPATPLLDLGVVLRVRRTSGRKGDSTVKLRPCRWSQLHRDYTEPDGKELKIEADWAGDRHSLAASLTLEWDDDRLDRGLAPADLFGERAAEFLDRCAPGRVNLATVTALRRFDAVRWAAFPAEVDGVPVSIRAERWTVAADLDFLELSVVEPPGGAVKAQAALEAFATSHGLPPDKSPLNKTQRVLAHLANVAT